MNTQQAFNKSVLAIIEQGQPAVHEEECAYFTDGLKCAVGVLFDDEKAAYLEESFGGENLGSEKLRAYILSQMPEVDLVVLNELQDAHDNSANNRFVDFIDGFTIRAKRVAEENDLTFPEAA